MDACVGDLVLVTWLDAKDHDDTWVDKADAEAFTDVEVTVRSVGFLVRKGPKYVTIGGDWDAGDQDYGTVRKIPLGMVVSITQLVEAETTQR